MSSKLVKIVTIALILVIVLGATAAAFAATDDGDTTAATTTEETEDSSASGKGMAAGVAIGLAALGGAIGMGILVYGSVVGIARQPEAEGKIRTTMMLGLVFVETAIIYALVIAILIIFVL